MFELIYNYFVQILANYQLFPLLLTIVVCLLCIIAFYALVSGVFQLAEWIIVGIVNGFSQRQR